jgi:TetR/AcrR family fatty acid metabolism transcriptional regulator
MRGRKKSEKTRTAIVQCAGEVFSQREFHEVLTDDIAQRLGIGKGTIYRYFDSKEALYLAAIGEGLNGLHVAITAVLEQAAPLRATVEALVRTMITYFWRQRDFFVLMHRLESKLRAEERADWRRHRNEANGMVSRVLDRAVASGEIAPVNTRLAVEVLFGMIRAVCVYRAEDDRPDDLSRLVTTLFLRGVIGGSDLPAGRTRALKMIK